VRAALPNPPRFASWLLLFDQISFFTLFLRARELCSREDRGVPEGPPKSGHEPGVESEALKSVLNFIGDMHQALHCENDGDKGGNTRRVIFEHHPDQLHWVWDTGILEGIDRDPQELAAELERQITLQDRADWDQGTIEDWVLQSHRLAQSAAAESQSSSASIDHASRDRP
jgi:S1/P1 Nuclease